MNVGDLVKVYHFSHTARRGYKARYVDLVDAYMPDDIDGYMIGLVVPKNGTFPSEDYRVVLRSIDGQTEPYKVDRLEVIHESR